ncbi:MAG: XTP/dITP diphosphatase [Bacilli bacterium]|nr:XTP/dITP diphosphatase [Bacilli bacterium]
MKTIIIATKNKGKASEFAAFFAKYGIKVKSLADIRKNITIEETGSTFKENALIKAHTVCKILKKPVLADDSGLEVAILNNQPGVYSARYAGENSNDFLNNQKLLYMLRGVPDKLRKARFVCALALVYPKGKEIVVEGVCEGYILEAMRGTNGFGYDPLFYVPELGKTFAELTEEEKMKISHRGRALMQLEKVLEDVKDSGSK